MMSYRGYGARTAVAALALFSMWSVAVPQQSGTVAHQTLTFAGTTTAVVQIEVAGFRSPDTTTELLIEFIRDGNGGASPPPDPSLPAARGPRPEVLQIQWQYLHQVCSGRHPCLPVNETRS
jgi:hypothetical protein